MIYYTLYKITNLVNDKFYYGVHHIKSLKKEDIHDSYMGSGTAIKHALKKYGRGNFKKEVLCIGGFDYIYDLEKKIVNSMLVEDQNCYNIMVGGIGAVAGEYSPMYGKKHSEETKAKLCVARKDKTPNKGNHHTDESKAKISAGSKRIAGEDHYMYGKHISDETKAKISKALKGKRHSDETKTIMSESRKGYGNPFYKKRHTDESKVKMSAAKYGKSQPIITCPHCSKNGGSRLMKRYHFDNCKQNPDNKKPA